MRRWIRMSIIVSPLLYGSYLTWNYFQTTLGYKLESSVTSPSGRWQAYHYSVWVEHGFPTAEWDEVHLVDTTKSATPQNVFGFDRSPIAMNWRSDATLQIKLNNGVYIGTRKKQLGDVKIELAFEPNDRRSRRERLIELKIPKDEWWWYDIPVD